MGCLEQPVWYRVVINGKSAGDALGVQIADRAGLWLESAFVDQHSELARFVSLIRQVDAEAFTSLDAMREVTYDVPTPGVVHIRIPPRYLRQQLLRHPSGKAEREIAHGSGVRLGYDLYASQRLDANEPLNGSAFVDGSWFSAHGNLRNTGLLVHGLESRAVRLETAWEREWFAQDVFAILGDHIGPADAFGRQPRRGGVSLRRAFEFDPQIIRYPLPLLVGESELPATVDLYVDNVRRDRYEVDGGSFAITHPPLLAGAGTAQLVVTNILGEQVVYEQPFFVSPQLLNPGVWDFSFSAGARREGYAQRSLDYADPEATLNWRYGLSSQWTTDGSAAASPHSGILELGMAGVPVRVLPMRLNGGLGAYRLPSGESGVLGRAGWSWQSGKWFADLSHRHAIPAREYSTESELPYRVRQLGRLGFRLRTTAISLNYLRRDTPGQDPFRQSALRVSWRPRHGRWGQLAAEIYRMRFARSEPQDVGARLNWIWSPKPRQQSLAYIEDESRAGWQYQWMRQGDLGRQLSLQGRRDQSGQPYFAADLDFQSSVLGLRGRAVSSPSGEQAALGLRGTLGWMHGSSFVGRDTGQAFALVDLNGLDDVTIYRDNQPVARTNPSGVALIPGLRPYQDNRIHLNPADIPLDWSLPTTQQIVRPGVNTGLHVAFETAPQRRAQFRAYRAPGRPVPAGAQVLSDSGERLGYAGAEGRVYVAGLGRGDNVLHVDWVTDSCRVIVRWPDAPDTELGVDLGDRHCQ